MAEFFKRPIKGACLPGILMVGGTFTTTTNGTIGTTDCYGCTIVKTAATTGRYTITLNRAVVKRVTECVSIIGPDTAALTTTKGLTSVMRADALASTGTINLQFVQTNAGNIDTDLQDGAKVGFIMWVVDSGAR